MQTIITQRGYSQEETFAAKTWHDGPVKTVGMADWHTVSASGWMPVGSVEFCRAAMIHQGIPVPEPLDYPTCLQAFMPEKPTLCTWAEAKSIMMDVMMKKKVKAQRNKTVANIWHVKPWQTKLDRELWTPETRVWVMPDHAFAAEHRVYVCQGEVLGWGRYDDGKGDPAWSLKTIKQMVQIYQDSGTAPAGYGLDVGVSAVDGKTYLVEVNDGWALGLYKGTCHGRDYLKLLQARWAEIAKVQIEAQNERR